MSIIYEALKKTQRTPESANRETCARQQQSVRSSTSSLLKKQLGLAGAAAGILLTWLIINKLSFPIISAHRVKTGHPSSANPRGSGRAVKNTPEALAFSQARPYLLLNGIVLSEDGSLAMINDQICKAGDEIEGAKIEEITDSRVVLRFKNQEIVLKNK